MPTDLPDVILRYLERDTDRDIDSLVNLFADDATVIVRSTSALVGRVRRLGGVGGGRPAAEQLERLFGPRSGLGGVGEDRQAVVGGEVETVEAQSELADDRMVKVLDASVVEADVVRGPADAERFAVCRELADEV